MELYPYQKKAIDELRVAFKKGAKRVVLCLPTGAGKSIVFTEMVRLAYEKGTKTLVLTDRTELFKQAVGYISSVSIPVEEIHADKKNIYKDGLVYVGMVETLKRRKKQLSALNPGLIIVDECFVDGTKVGNKEIQNIKIGDMVDTFNHDKQIIEKKLVLNISKKEVCTQDLISIKYQYGVIECTKEHPIYIVNKNRYVRACEVRRGDIIIMSSMWRNNRERCDRKTSVVEKKTCTSKWKENNVFKKLSMGKKERQSNRKKSYAICFCKRKNDYDIKKDWTQTEAKRWKWTRFNNSTKDFTRRSSKWMEDRVCSTHKGCNTTEKISIALQSRPSKSRLKDCSRDRRLKSLCFKGTECGRKKGNFFTFNRVESVTIQKQGDRGKLRESFVYNLHVEDNNNYFANGVLVHNCHMGNFTPIFEMYPDAKVIGATATPAGHHFFDYYQDIVQTVDVPELVSDGFLVPCKPYQMVDSFDDLKTKRGEFTFDSLSAHYDKPTLYLGVIEQWRKYAEGKKTIVFCVNIEHTEHTYQAFVDAGISAERITSKTSNEEREKILKAYTNNSFLVLVNCGILTKGYNEPSIECVIMNRATQSIALWLQCCGRGSRTFAGKKNFILLDFGGNHERLGLWNEPRTWKLKAKKETIGDAPCKVCPECLTPTFTTAKECAECKFVFPVKEKEDKKGVMVEVQPHTPKEFIGRRVGDLSITELCILQKAKKYKATFIWRLVRHKGEQALYEYAEKMGYSHGWVYQQKNKLSESDFNNYILS